MSGARFACSESEVEDDRGRKDDSRVREFMISWAAEDHLTKLFGTMIDTYRFSILQTLVSRGRFHSVASLSEEG